MRYLTAIQPRAKTRTHNMANSAAIAKFCMSGLGKSIQGVIVFMGRSIQEMGGNVVIGHSYGVIVIDGLLYSWFYGMCIESVNDRSFCLELVAPMGRSIHGVYVFME